jgi:WXG100 family type VII secretion target
MIMATATYTDVDTTQIEQAVLRIRQSVDSIKGVRDALKTQVLGKLSTAWQGEAKELFFAQYTEFFISFDRLAAGYEVLNAELKSEGMDYQAADDFAMAVSNKLPSW